MHITYTPLGTCSKRIDIEIQDGLIQSVSATGGCMGNIAGLNALLKGRPIDEAIAKLKGIKCGKRATSCPDQIANALSQYAGD